MGADSYICRSYRGKTGRGGCFLAPSSWIGLKEQLFLPFSGQFCQIKIKKISNKRLDLFIKYLLRPILCGLFLSYTLWLLKISFCVSEAVIGRCSEIYSLEINAKPATRDINHFLIDVDRGLHSCLLPTKFRTSIQKKPPWFIICIDCSKDV